MTFATYYPTIPNPPDDPGDDVALMQTNSGSISSLISIDHIGFNTINGGYHTNIHQNVQGSDPVTVASFQQSYVKNYTPDSTVTAADTALFTKTGLGIISQLSGKNTTSSSDGYAWVGGILIQWGDVTFASSTDHLTSTVTFKDRVTGAIPFPNNCFIVEATLKVASTGTTTASNTIAIRSKSITDFKWLYNSSASGGSALFPGFYWVAIGN